MASRTRGRVAVVGGGIAGLACARTLTLRGLEAVVFESEAEPGGRCATRAEGPHVFDHGAQYFTVREPGFRNLVEACAREGVVAPWEGSIHTLRAGVIGATDSEIERWVALPGMSALAAHLSAGLEVRADTRVEWLVRGDGWSVRSHGRRNRCTGRDEDEAADSGTFDAVALAVPAPCAVPLLVGASTQPTELLEPVARIAMAPVWATLLAFEDRLDPGFDGAFVADSPLAWAARNTSKPARAGTECWVLHATPAWSFERADWSAAAAASALREAFERALGPSLPTASLEIGHRWAYASTPAPLGALSLYDPSARIGLCGDWCVGGRVEGAFMSGLSLAERILESNP